jgi:NADH-quinone oxidoreductase E subunit
MAWIVKPSADTEIERRDEPYLTPAMQKRHTEVTLPRYETKQGAVIPILHDVQHEYGYLPLQALIEVATFLELKPADVLDTASFYEEFHTEPVGECIIGICQSIACEICGHEALLDHVRQKLGIEPHETTADGKFTLLTMECLGSCDTAPVALFNDKLHENLTIEQIDRLIEKGDG